jgi:hypothetical protein
MGLNGLRVCHGPVGQRGFATESQLGKATRSQLWLATRSRLWLQLDVDLSFGLTAVAILQFASPGMGAERLENLLWPGRTKRVATGGRLELGPTVVVILQFASLGMGAERLENLPWPGRTKMACDWTSTLACDRS